MKKYQNIQPRTDHPPQIQQLPPLQKQNENPPTQHHHPNPTKNFSLILPSSLKKNSLNLPPSDPNKQGKVVHQFLNNCFVSKNPKRLFLKKETQSTSEIRQGEQNRRESSIQQQVERNRTERIDEVKEQSVDGEYRVSILSHKTENIQIKQQKLEKLQPKYVNLQSYPLPDKQSFSFNQNCRINVPLINLTKLKPDEKKKAKSQQRQAMGCEKGSPKKVQIILPNINDAVLERHHRLKLLHTKKKPKSQIFSQQTKSNEIFINQIKKLNDKKLQIGSRIAISKYHMIRKLAESHPQKRILILKNHSIKK